MLVFLKKPGMNRDDFRQHQCLEYRIPFLCDWKMLRRGKMKQLIILFVAPGKKPIPKTFVHNDFQLQCVLRF